MQVDFPLVLDMYDFCSDELKKQLAGPREAVKAEEDRKANMDRAVKKAKMVKPHLLRCCWLLSQSSAVAVKLQLHVLGINSMLTLTCYETVCSATYTLPSSVRTSLLVISGHANICDECTCAAAM